MVTAKVPGTRKHLIPGWGHTGALTCGHGIDPHLETGSLVSPRSSVDIGFLVIFQLTLKSSSDSVFLKIGCYLFSLAEHIPAIEGLCLRSGVSGNPVCAPASGKPSELLLDMITLIGGCDFQPSLWGIYHERDGEGIVKENKRSLFQSSK